MTTSFNQNLNNLLSIISDNNKLKLIQKHEVQFYDIYENTTFYDFMHSELSQLILNYPQVLKINKNADENYTNMMMKKIWKIY